MSSNLANAIIYSIAPQNYMPETRLPEIKEREIIRVLAEVVEALLRQWELGCAEQRQLLGMENWAGAGEGSPLPSGAAMLERFGQLLAISRALEILDPQSPALGT